MDEDTQDAGGFDLESYIGSYSGHNKVDRLVFIAEKSYGKPLELEALKLAHDEVKKTENTSKYTEIIERINGRLGPAYTMDRAWFDQVERRAAQKQERLEAELHNYKTNLIKESIRMGHNDLGDFFYDRGDLTNAFKSYVRSRDYCTTSRHITAMCLNVIRVAVEMNNDLHISNYVSKAEAVPDALSDPVVAGKLAAASGLAFLHCRKYKQAARKFLDISTELGTSYNDVVAPQDIAIYGGLCALASFERDELKRRVISNIAFKEFLELVPEVRELIHDFHNSRYASCLKTLSALEQQLLMDTHLHSHVRQLYSQIRQKALIQYSAPFTSVNLHLMASAFNTPVSELEKQLASLIMDNQVQARIDSHSKVMYARHADVRGNTFHRVLSCGEEYMRETKALLLRANMLQHDFVQRPRRGAGGGSAAEDYEMGFGPGVPRGAEGGRRMGMLERRGPSGAL